MPCVMQGIQECEHAGAIQPKAEEKPKAYGQLAAYLTGIPGYSRGHPALPAGERPGTKDRAGLLAAMTAKAQPEQQGFLPGRLCALFRFGLVAVGTWVEEEFRIEWGIASTRGKC